MKRKLTVFGLITFLTIPFTVAVTTQLNQTIAQVEVETYNGIDQTDAQSKYKGVLTLKNNKKLSLSNKLDTFSAI